MAEYKTTDVIRMRCGSPDPFQDNSAHVWWGDQAYVASKKQLGYNVAGTTATSTTVISNAPYSQPLFQSYRESSTSLDYRFDVAAGDYNVQLYFAEVSNNTTRLMDIALEGTTVATGFNVSPTPGVNRVTIQSFDVTVSDGTLNINITRNSSAGASVYPRIAAIAVKKLQIQP